MLQAAKQAFPEINMLNLSESYNLMLYHKRIFRNNPPWKRTRASGLYARGYRNRKRLNAAKVLCDKFSSMTFSEQVEITIDDEVYQRYINQTLNTVGFWKCFPEILSYGYAMGGCVLKTYVDNNKPAVNYIQAEHFLPLSWNGEFVSECVFRTNSYKNGYYYTLMEKHTFDNNSKVSVKNVLFKSSVPDCLGSVCSINELFPGLPDEVCYTDFNLPLFSYFKPCVSNNVEVDSPLGLSIYANSIDTLEALDIAFDSFMREFTLGKKRIIVPASCIRTVVDPMTGKEERYFDADDEAFVALKTADNEVLKIVDNTTELRIEEHVSAINALLNILCFQVGLSPGTLSFDAVQGMKTATEVVSQNSETARTIKSNKNIVTEVLEHLIHCLITVGVSLSLIPQKNYTVTIGWQDNVVIDDNTLIDNNIKLVQAGLKSKVKAIMDVQKCDEETAMKELERIAKEQSVTGLTVDDFMNGGEDDDETGDDAAQSGAE